MLNFEDSFGRFHKVDLFKSFWQLFDRFFEPDLYFSPSVWTFALCELSIDVCQLSPTKSYLLHYYPKHLPLGSSILSLPWNDCWEVCGSVILQQRSFQEMYSTIYFFRCHHLFQDLDYFDDFNFCLLEFQRHLIWDLAQLQENLL